jgi:hypothetical protein
MKRPGPISTVFSETGIIHLKAARILMLRAIAWRLLNSGHMTEDL